MKLVKIAIVLLLFGLSTQSFAKKNACKCQASVTHHKGNDQIELRFGARRGITWLNTRAELDSIEDNNSTIFTAIDAEGRFIDVVDCSISQRTRTANLAFSVLNGSTPNTAYHCSIALDASCNGSQMRCTLAND